MLAPLQVVRNEAAGATQLRHVDAGLDAEAVEQIDARPRSRRCRSAPLAYGQPPSPATEQSNVATPHFERTRRCWRAPGRRCRGNGRQVRSTGTRCGDALDQRLRLARRAGADRVAERHLVRAHRMQRARRRRATAPASTSPSYGQPSTTRCSRARACRAPRAASNDRRARSRLSAIEQLMLRLRERFGRGDEHRHLVGARRAAPPRSPSCSASAPDSARRACARMRAITSAASAICGTHFGDTNDVASIAGRPASVSMSISATLTSVGTIAFSFCKPSRGPTSHSRTARGSSGEALIAPRRPRSQDPRRRRDRRLRRRDRRRAKLHRDDNAGRGCGDRVFHLHRLEHDERRTFFDRIARFRP